MTVTSADEFYSIMAVLTREMLEFGLMDANNLINVSMTTVVDDLKCLRLPIFFSLTAIVIAHFPKKSSSFNSARFYLKYSIIKLFEKL